MSDRLPRLYEAVRALADHLGIAPRPPTDEETIEAAWGNIGVEEPTLTRDQVRQALDNTQRASN